MRKADQGAFSSAGPAHQTDTDAIARRAYELYEQRGSEQGHEIEDWLQAEAELTARSEGANTHDIGDRLDGVPDIRSSSDTESSGTASARKGNGNKRSQRQPNSH